MNQLSIIYTRIFFFIFCNFRSNILRNIDQHRARSSCLGNAECLSNCLCKLCYIFNDKTVFCDRHCNSCNVDLLETVFSKQWNSNITCDCNNRNRIHICCCDSCYKIRCPRSACCKADTYFSCSSRISVSCVCCSLLMRSQDMTDLITVFIKLIIYI